MTDLKAKVLRFGNLTTLAALASALLFTACSSEPDPGPRTNLGIMSALPLFWSEGTSPADMLKGEDQRAPLVKALLAHHVVKPVDAVNAQGMSGVKLLILAQPRLLQPEELVALDQWVQKGGRLLIFADPILAWPSELPLGDRRRAPPITLLDPLYQHWGLGLDNPDEGAPQMIETEIEGQKTALVSPGKWRLAEVARDCSIDTGGLIADCHFGKGQALLVADADMLDSRLWTEKGQDGSRAVIALVARMTRSGGGS